MRPSSSRLACSLLLSLLASGCLFGSDDDEGDDDEVAMDEGSGTGSVDEGECFEPPQCDPLVSDCEDGELCSASLGSFECTPVPEGTELLGEGEACGAASCQEGLTCVASCNAGSGCCLPLCDLEQPQCASGRACVPYYAVGSTICYAHVGVCEPA